MLKYLLLISTLLFSLFFFSACVGQPTAPVAKAKKTAGSGTLWAESKNVDADEDDNVDVSDLNKDVTSGAEATSGVDKKVRISFPAEEYSTLERTGKGTIQGYIYLQDAYGTKINGAKTRLYLNPVTSYSRQWYEDSYIGGYKMGKADSRLFNYLKFTASDESGAFAFYGVPTGKYYLIGTVACGTQCGYSSSKNIRIATELFISGNQILNQDLTRSIQR
ncbi:MAG: carboxypeptidase regulatory-like domain-containing protein [Campylobacterota bacterium]|nr:carboxypeptidase regulatory-like domain-containing protein [Campylobacterota bacterium]